MPRIRYHNFDMYARNTLARVRRDQPTHIAIDTETTGLKWTDRPFGVSCAWLDPQYKVQTGWFELDDEMAAQLCAEFFEYMSNFGVTHLYFNAKFDIRMLINVGLMPGFPGLWEDMLIPTAYVRPSGQRDLKSTARDFLYMTTNEDAVLKQVRKELKLKKEDGYWPIPREYIIPYAQKDAVMTLMLYKYYIARYDLSNPLLQKEKKLLKILTEMEFAGLKVERDKLKQEIRQSDAIIANNRSIIQTYVGKKIGKKVKEGEFNPGSHIQLKGWIKENYDIDLPDTQSATLEQYGERIPMLRHLSVLKKEEKLVGTYLRPMLAELDQRDILHPNWNEFGTNTGRLSSSGEADG